jgi:hypothetical protein
MVSKKILKIPKGIIRIRKSKKDRQHNGQKKKEQTTIYKTLHQYQQSKQPPLTSIHWTCTKKTSRNSGLAQTPNCGVVKSVNGILPVPSWLLDVNKQ